MFIAYFNGELIGTSLTETFPYGVATTNGERHNAADTPASNFGGLEYNSGTWNDWDGHDCWKDTDSDYSNDYFAPNHVEVDSANGSDKCSS